MCEILRKRAEYFFLQLCTVLSDSKIFIITIVTLTTYVHLDSEYYPDSYFLKADQGTLAS